LQETKTSLKLLSLWFNLFHEAQQQNYSYC